MHKVIDYVIFNTVMTQSQIYRVSAVLEYKDRDGFGVCISVRDKRKPWGNKGAIYYTHFHVHNVNAKAPYFPLAHFKEGMGKMAPQGWDLHEEPCKAVLKILSEKNLQKNVWVDLN
jgi:hypothetical protein